jgi:phage shock protein E
MIAFIKQIFGIAPKVDLNDVMARNATIVDVRTIGEYTQGSVGGSLNIPLAELQSRMASIPKDKPVVTCCASGMRSASARSVLLSNGFKEVYNGGSWQKLKRFEK